MCYLDYVPFQEMVISPVLLDFLEQALEPIPMSVSQDKSQQTKSKLFEVDKKDIEPKILSVY